MTRDNVLIELYGSRFWKDIKSDFVSEAKKAKTLKKMSEFMKKWSYYYMYDSPATSMKRRSLEMRKALISGGFKDDDAILEFFKMPSEIYTMLNNNDTKKVIENLEKSENDEINYANLADNLIKKLSDYIDNNELLNTSSNSNRDRELAYIKVFLLSVATGRRQIEILKLLDISKKKDLAEYKNLAKKKSDDKDSVIAPILIDINLAKKYLKDIRDVFQTENLTNKQVNSKFSGVIKKALVRYLPELKDEGLHYFRKIYAEACFSKFAQDKNKNKYFSDILGHEFKVNSAHHYEAKK